MSPCAELMKQQRLPSKMRSTWALETLPIACPDCCSKPRPCGRADGLEPDLPQAPSWARARSNTTAGSVRTARKGTRRRNTTPGILPLAVQLTSSQGDGDGVGGLGKWARPGGVVGAGGVISEVEVGDQPATVSAEVGSLRRVDEVATAAVGLCARKGVLDRNEQAPTVGGQPPDVESADPAQVQAAGALERDDAIGAGGDRQAPGLDIGVDVDLE